MATELDRLEKLGEFRTDEEEGRYRELKAQAAPKGKAGGKTAAPPPQGAPPPARAGAVVEVSLNKEAFERGGLTFRPPSGPGIYPARWTDVLVPTFVEGQLWFLFEGVDADKPFKGALVCGALNEPSEKSGAWKVKQVLEALGVPYEETAYGVRFVVEPGKSCQVDWQVVDLRGKKELRIQDVYSAGAQIGSL